MRRRHVACAVAVSLMLVSGLAGEATAQDAASDTTDDMKLDDRWTPWLGCWQLWEEQFEPGDELEDERSIVGRTSVCVTPAEAGISLTATAGEQLLVERRLVADGTQHEVDEDGCQGWERSDWSFDGQRLFTAAELRCGDAPTRTVTGVSLMSSASIWVDIQFVQIGDREQLEEMQDEYGCRFGGGSAYLDAIVTGLDADSPLTALLAYTESHGAATTETQRRSAQR